MQKLEKELVRVKNENKELSQQLYSAQTEPSIVERIVRTKLNFVKPGETVYRFIPKEKSKK